MYNGRTYTYTSFSRAPIRGRCRSWLLWRLRRVRLVRARMASGSVSARWFLFVCMCVCKVVPVCMFVCMCV